MSYQKVIDKINKNTIKCTDFYDFAEPLEVFKRKLNVDVTPQLEEVNFYKGGRIREYGYIPESPEFQKYLSEERERGIRKETQLVKLFNNFKQGHICFVGPAGCGKSTLMKSTSRKVSHGKYFQGIIKMIQYIECKQFMNNSKVTAGELIFNNLTKEEVSLAVDYAKTHPEEVLFMLDSLDTLQYTVDGVYEIISLDEPACPEVIIWNLLTGKLFPGIRNITSSREHSIRNYWGEVRPDKVIALAGLTMESIKEIISGYEGNEEAKKIMEFLKIQAPILMVLCTTPVMLVYTLIALKFKSEFKPNTMTGSMVVVMQSVLRSPHTHQENMLEVLGKLKELSYIGTVERRVLFTENDFRQVNLKPEQATDLAILAPGGIYRKLFQGIHLLYFQHQSIQEMLTSFYILGLDLKSFEKFVDEDLHIGHFVLIRKMMCGLLLNPKVYEAAASLLEEIKHLEKKRDILKASLQLQLKKLSNKSDLLELFAALNEAKDGMSDIVKSSLDTIDMSGHPLSISDVHVIGAVASHCTSLIMNFRNCDLKSASLQTLASGLKESNVEISELLLDGNTNMGVEGLSSVGQILPNHSCVIYLGLKNCNLSSDQLQAFKSSICNKIKIDQLNLYEDHIAHHEDIVAVANLLPNVTKKLWLQGWKIGEEEEEILQNQLDEIRSEELRICLNEKILKSQKKTAYSTTEVNSKQIPETDFGPTSPHGSFKNTVENMETLDKVGSPRSKIPRIEVEEIQPVDELSPYGLLKSDLHDARVTYDLVEVLYKHRDDKKEVICEAIKDISINHYNLNDVNIKVFLTTISKLDKLEMLNVQNCGTSEYLNNFFEKLGRTNCKIAKISIWEMKNLKIYSKSLLKLLAKSETESLKIQAVELGDEDVYQLLEDIKDLNSEYSLSVLSVSHNTKMGLEGFCKFGEILHILPVKTINLFDCDLTDDKLSNLFGSLKHKQISTLDVSGNTEIMHEGFKIIGQMSANSELRNLHVRCCELDEAKLKSLQSSCKSNTEISKLDVSYNITLGSEGMAELGRTVINFKVENLNIAGCALNKKLMEAFRLSIEKEKFMVEVLNISRNPKLENGIVEVARLLESCCMKKVNMSKCMLSAGNIHEFSSILREKNIQVETLNISENNPTFIATRRHAEAVCELLRNVSKELIFKITSIKPQVRRILQHGLEELSKEKKTKIILGNGDILEPKNRQAQPTTT
uniref:uncharacterized protein LOC120331832 n=1 Tax=Styela clava TaxID=7725 RepID=UPI00193A2C7F|nr:uncharacterized protein LOC120331832 [Styela clava]